MSSNGRLRLLFPPLGGIEFYPFHQGRDKYKKRSMISCESCLKTKKVIHGPFQGPSLYHLYWWSLINPLQNKAINERRR
jgi:hypothetical protein